MSARSNVKKKKNIYIYIYRERERERERALRTGTFVTKKDTFVTR